MAATTFASSTALALSLPGGVTMIVFLADILLGDFCRAEGRRFSGREEELDEYDVDDNDDDGDGG